jgi:hypothetical protein
MMEVRMLRTILAVGVVSVGILAMAVLPLRADDDENDPAALAKVLTEATITLDQGLKASQQQGRPISGKFETDDGALQLSIYTMNGDQFSEVVVDHISGAIKKAEKITEGEDLKNAQEQSAAMARAKTSLDQAVENAVRSNDGYRAVSVVPVLAASVAVANITLMKGAEVRNVTEKLE